jgi:hypothetical protein
MESQNFTPQRHQITANSPIQTALEAVLQGVSVAVSADGNTAIVGGSLDNGDRNSASL